MIRVFHRQRERVLDCSNQIKPESISPHRKHTLGFRKPVFWLHACIKKTFICLRQSYFSLTKHKELCQPLTLIQANKASFLTFFFIYI